MLRQGPSIKLLEGRKGHDAGKGEEERNISDINCEERLIKEGSRNEGLKGNLTFKFDFWVDEDGVVSGNQGRRKRAAFLKGR